MQEFNEDAIRAVLEGLAPWNLRVMWASKRFKVGQNFPVSLLSIPSQDCGDMLYLSPETLSKARPN